MKWAFCDKRIDSGIVIYNFKDGTIMLAEHFLLYLFSENCCMLGLAVLGLLEGEHVLANIQRNHPINSCIHCGHFSSLFGKFLESFGARPRVKAKAGKKGSFYSNINEISSRRPPIWSVYLFTVETKVENKTQGRH